jgi:hypothetical protein
MKMKSSFSVESRTDALISELMASSQRSSDPQKVLEEIEKERRDMEELFSMKAGMADKLREQEIKCKSPSIRGPMLWSIYFAISNNFRRKRRRFY